MKLLDPHNIHLLDRTLLDVFKLIVFCTQHLWGSKYPFPHPELTQQPVSSSQRREIQRPRSVLFTSHGYLHMEMSRFSYKCWYCICCSNKSHSTAASLDSALTRRAHEELNPQQQCCELGPLWILQMSADLSSFGEGAAAQIRKSLMFLQRSADNQLSTSGAMRMRTSSLPEELRDQ